MHRAVKLGSAIADLERVRRKRLLQDAQTLERLARRAGLAPEIAARLANNLAPEAPSQWTFVMLSPTQNAAVVRWIAANAKRPQKSLALWAELFVALRSDTGEILTSRQDLADRVGMAPRHVSEAMSELASINAIRRENAGRRVRYFMSPQVATHIPDRDGRDQAREAAGPLLVLMEGGRQDD